MLCPPVRKRHYSTVLLTWSSFVHVVSWRSSMKNKELDLLIVVNMFLTGFDATTLNTLWVDKNLKMHGLIQAYREMVNRPTPTMLSRMKNSAALK